MRTAHASFMTAIANLTLKVCELYIFELQNGAVYRYTSHSKDIIWESTDEVYHAIPIIRGPIRYSNNFESDEVEITLSNIGSDFYDLIHHNILEGVKITIKRILWNDTYASDKELLIYEGIGDISFNRTIIIINTRPAYDRLNVKLPKNLFQEPCNHTLFNDGCQLNQSDYEFTGTATGGSELTLEDSLIGTIYKVAFDNGDESNPLVSGMLLEEYGGAVSENYFLGDTHCVALWKLDDGVLTVDDVGGNTLVNTSVVNDAADYKEGNACGVWDTGRRLVIDDADLDAGFPLKDGAGNDQISIAFWTKINAHRHLGVFFSKWASVAGDRSIMVTENLVGAVYNVTLYVGHTGGTGTEIISYAGKALDVDTWYHIGVTYDVATKAYRIRVYDADADTVSEGTGNSTNSMSTGDYRVGLGVYGPTSGTLEAKIDEMVIFNDLLTADEIDEIRSGTYNEGAPASTAPVLLAITYLTSSTGYLWYLVDAVTGPFNNNDIIGEVGAGVGDPVVTINGVSAEEDSNLYMHGELEITSGDNDGQRRQILSVDTGVITVMYPFPKAIAVGVTYSIFPGCDKKAETCRNRFNNEDNFKGFLYIPKYEETIL